MRNHVNKLTKCIIHSNIKLCEGGDTLVKDTIQAIKETEQKAEEIITNAKKEGEQLIEQARQEALDMEGKMTGDAEKAARAAGSAARDEADEKLRDALKEAEEEIRQLKASAQSREQEAVAAVIQALV